MLSASTICTTAYAGDDGMIKWKQGQGWGWVWGKDDQVGALNEMTDASRLAAMKAIKSGRVFDLGLPMDRNSYHWDGHGPLELMMFRTPHGIKTMRDFDFMTPEGGNTSGTAWQSAQLFMSDNTGTKFDGLGHVTVGPDDHFYNGYKSGSHQCEDTCADSNDGR
ncbi:hypothetical protein [Caballeronia sordidicola]|uniref:hypothetical protein n=1 Tax=Caballeronia sordidicola TaxID=196367 RepID=UPI00117F7E2C|nr:hypothetical protein [Caballeronia sordidicola]